ncbi:MAG: hypothetical protein ABJB01_11885 [Rudaea sp.]
MRDSDVPLKTAAGLQEIGLKQRKLQPKSRSLLIMVHGAETVAQLERSMHSLGDVRAILDELIGLGLVAVKGGAGSVMTEIAANNESVIPAAQQVKQLLNETAVASLGMLGGLTAFRFTLKLEHCYTADELRTIFPDFRKIVAKAKNDAFADAILTRAEALLKTG